MKTFFLDLSSEEGKLHVSLTEINLMKIKKIF
jgi:hypothetical protein